MERIQIFRYSRAGEQLGVLPYVSAMHAEELDGTDELTVSTHSDLSKGDRLVWRDSGGAWHEHMVDSIERSRDGGRPLTEATCINSFAETYGLLCSGAVLTGTVQSILSRILSGTRWACGSCDVAGTFEVEVWHKSVHDAVSDLVNECGGEFEAYVAVDSSGVASRTARIAARRGSESVTRQFAYGRNMTDASKSVGSDDPVTAVRAFGAKTDEESEDEYAARLTVEVADASLVPYYGTPQADGTLGHTWAVYTDDTCDDADFLRQQAARTLRNLSQPDVEYEFGLSDVESTRLSIGDAVSVVDDEFGAPVSSRLTRIERDLTGKTAGTVRVGKRRELLVEQYQAVDRTAQQVTGNMARVASTAPTYTGGDYGGGGSGGGSGGDSQHYLNGSPYSGPVYFTTRRT